VTLANAAGDVVKLDLTVEKSGGAGATAAVRPGQPARPGTPPAPGQPPGSPAAGIANQPSPAAGVQPRVPRRPAGQPAPGVAPPRRPGVAPQPPVTGVPNLPPGVREKLEQLKGS
jgi:hypothetical protein